MFEEADKCCFGRRETAASPPARLLDKPALLECLDDERMDIALPRDRRRVGELVADVAGDGRNDPPAPGGGFRHLAALQALERHCRGKVGAEILGRD